MDAAMKVAEVEKVKVETVYIRYNPHYGCEPLKVEVHYESLRGDEM